jgi:hypothetical protein
VRVRVFCCRFWKAVLETRKIQRAKANSLRRSIGSAGSAEGDTQICSLLFSKFSWILDDYGSTDGLCYISRTLSTSGTDQPIKCRDLDMNSREFRDSQNLLACMFRETRKGSSSSFYLRTVWRLTRSHRLRLRGIILQ